jgi:thymidylate kinase
MQSAVRDSYRRQAREQDWIMLDGERGKDEVAADVFSVVTSRLGPL